MRWLIRRWWLVVIAVAAAGGGVAAVRHSTRPGAAPKMAEVDTGPLEVSFSGTGPLSAVSTVQVGSQVSGTISELMADFNSQVKAADVVARLDPSLYMAALEQAEASVAIAQASRAGALANLATSEANLTSAQQQLVAAEASVTAAQCAIESAQANQQATVGNQQRNLANLRQAELTRDRTLVLYERRLTSGEERDQAVTGQSTALAAVQSGEAEILRAEVQVRQARADAARTVAQREQLRAEILRAQAGIAQAQASLKEADARLKQAMASQRRAQVDVTNCTIVSPIDGVVVSRAVDVGQTVAASFQAPVLFTIAGDLARMQVQAAVSESDIGQVHPGRAVRFRVDAHPDREFPGTVRQVRLNPTTINNVVEYTVIIDTDNPEGLLLPGMTADVRFPVQRVERAVRVPNAALRLQMPPEKISTAGRERLQQRQMAMTNPGANASAGANPGANPGERASRAAIGRVWVIDPDEPTRFLPVFFRAGLRDSAFTEVLDQTALPLGTLVVTALPPATPVIGR